MQILVFDHMTMRSELKFKHAISKYDLNKLENYDYILYTTYLI